MAEFELHGAQTGNCYRAAIGLLEAGLTFDVKLVDLGAGEQRGDAFRAMNPAGQVPVLVRRSKDGTADFVLSQSNAILLYAADLAPGTLLPGNFDARAKVLEAYFSFLTDVITWNGVAFAMKGAGLPDASQKITERYLKRLIQAERFIGKGGFMGGDHFSLADIAAFTIVRALSDQLPWDSLPRLAEWRARIADRPTIKRGLTAFDRAA